MDTYKFFNHNLEYIQQNTDSVHIGERTIEIPIAKLWLSFYKDNIVEVGAVMPWWNNSALYQSEHPPVDVEHDVVDPYDSYDKCIKIDAENYNFTNKNVLSISTIEHIGVLDYLNRDLDQRKAGRVLKKIIKESKNYLLGWPIGYHKILDKDSLDIECNKFMLKQVQHNNRWEMTEVSIGYEYNNPYKYANAVIFLTNTLEWIK